MFQIKSYVLLLNIALASLLPIADLYYIISSEKYPKYVSIEIGFQLLESNPGEILKEF